MSKRIAVCIAALMLLWAGLNAAYADEAEDRLRMLYSSRVTFSASGVPEVAVGLMHSQTEVSLACDTGMIVQYYPAHKAVEAMLPAGATYSIRIINSRPGRVISHVVAATYRISSSQEAATELGLWKKRGYEAHMLQVGSLFSLGGRVIDNRLYMVSLGDFEDTDKAAELAGLIFKRHNLRAEISEELTSLPAGEMAIYGPDGGEVLRSRGLLMFSPYEDGVLHSPRVVNGQGFNQSIEPGAYRGKLYVALDRNGNMSLGNLADMEDVLAGTVGAEIFSSAPDEALKAQAVAARNHLLVKLGTRHFADPYLLCSTQHCQVYRGKASENERVRKAVEETRGLFLFSGDRPANTLYSAVSGGYTENNDNVWPQPPDPELRGLPDWPQADRRFIGGINEKNLEQFLTDPPRVYCMMAGYNEERIRWTRIFSATRVNDLLRRYNVGNVLDLKAAGRGVSGRLKGLVVKGAGGEVVLHDGLEIRRLFADLPSTLVRINIVRDPQGSPQSFEFSGAGWGHGVGMCQTGAIGRALTGQKAADILMHYYPGTEAVKLY